jgi:hypothetical protein
LFEWRAATILFESRKSRRGFGDAGHGGAVRFARI